MGEHKSPYLLTYLLTYHAAACCVVFFVMLTVQDHRSQWMPVEHQQERLTLSCRLYAGVDGIRRRKYVPENTNNYTLSRNCGNPYKKLSIVVARPHFWLQLGVVKPEIILCETVLNLSTLNTLTYLLT